MRRQTFLLLLSLTLLESLFAQRVGIGTISPLARFHVVDSNVVFSATGDIPTIQGNTSVTGTGRRLLWYPDKAAFRVGYVSGIGWDGGFIGNYSFAAGKNTLGIGVASTSFGNSSNAGGNYSVAIGNNCITNGISSVAMGEDNFVNGNYAVALGKGLSASNSFSVAMGDSTESTGYASTAFGDSTRASGFASTAMGFYSVATNRFTTAIGVFSKATGDASMAFGYDANSFGRNSMSFGTDLIVTGDYATAIGNTNTASGFMSTALGTQASTNGHAYSICIGANGNNPGNPSVANEHDNEFMVYADYYRLWTGPFGTSVFLTPGTNTWQSSCDKNLKENFETLDGEEVLKKIAGISFTSWNYKTQDPKKFRHYGIMAQDFYNAFGKDGYGTIGCDTLVNPIDMIGIDMTAIQALEKRTQSLSKLHEQVNALEKEKAAMKELLDAMQARLSELEKIVSKK